MTHTATRTKTILGNLAVLAIGVAVGYFLIGGGNDRQLDTPPAGKEKEVAYWVAPMDPNYRRDTPGKSPMGMDLIPVFVGEEPGGEDIGFSVSPNILASLGVKTAPAERSEFATRIDATGRIMYDETRVMRVQIRSEGWVESLAVRAIGETVRQNDLLFSIYSPEIASALAEFDQAQSSNSERLKALARGRLNALGLNDQMIKSAAESGDWSRPVNISSPATGVVTKLGVREGSLAAKNTVAFEITDASSVWLIADVFESQAPDVFVGQSVEVSGVGYSGEGTVDYIYPELDPMHQTVRARIVVPNEDGKLRAGQFYEARLRSKSSRQLTVPDTAIIRLGSSNRVIVDYGDGQFQAAEVELGATSSGRTVIKAGLEEGEQVVISGQFMLDSESSFIGAELRMVGKDAAEAPETAAFAVGTINSVDPESRVANVSHPVIPEIGLSAMTMDMLVVDDVELENIPVPSRVHFGVGQLASGGYVITVIHVMSDSMEGM